MIDVFDDLIFIFGDFEFGDIEELLFEGIEEGIEHFRVELGLIIRREVFGEHGEEILELGLIVYEGKGRESVVSFCAEELFKGGLFLLEVQVIEDRFKTMPDSNISDFLNQLLFFL